MPQNGFARRRAAANNGHNFATLQQQPPSFQSKPWFLGAPVTKILCIFWAAGSLWVINNYNDDPENYNITYDHNRNLWVAAMWNGPSDWVFQSSMELFVGLIFLAHFLRRLEQELSSRRLVAWILVSEAIYVLVRLMAVATLDEEIAGAFVASNSASGPYLFVGGVLYWYKAYVPRLYPRFLSSTTLGISCSEKAFPYLWALYVLLMRGTSTLLVGTIGVFTSATYFFLLSVSSKNIDGNNINLPLLDIPDAVVNMLPWESFGGLFLLDSNPKVYAPFITRATMIPRGDGRQRRQTGRGGTRLAHRVRPPAAEETPIAVAVPVPPPEAIAQLISMGFEEERVIEALQASENNVERAANILLSRS
mmetsp:Transcript_6559/g.16162  ORF Transcript_6559/g.16162 Transcript_6559/m.16162 type:complete len:364 (-) Transcript_6559:1097-2188(-)|eukprot:CAMPEP_0197196404 /NCGR_PEP_ID=MMETSP1423-20130617/32340_1 /TAXON_ID=476441 /ORGANISM="Pseudo-nitzschia heimii, Strain UNC1101" /LENGTH=363 /DNA_ID=CAMNT_0042650203 /DNA_START=96 /DNA_END=1187 /DNA_ORIENTATION=-